ncbi:hypothetical protein ACHQM5_015313 [Ranunculus cassubicifolius]
MEVKVLRVLVVLMIVFMGMVVDQIHAQGMMSASESHVSEQIFGIDKKNSKKFIRCYGKCFLFCNLPLPKPPICAAACLAKCTIFRSELLDVHNYCNLGCASSKCTHISTANDPRAEEVVTCVNSCSVGCGKHH